MLVVWLVTGRQSEAPAWCISKGSAVESPLKVLNESVLLNAWQLMSLCLSLSRCICGHLHCQDQTTCVTHTWRVQVFIPASPSGCSSMLMLPSLGLHQASAASQSKSTVIRAKRGNLTPPSLFPLSTRVSVNACHCLHKSTMIVYRLRTYEGSQLLKKKTAQRIRCFCCCCFDCFKSDRKEKKLE